MTVSGRKYFGTEEFLKIYYELIRTAQRKGTINYGDLAPIMGIPSPGHHMSKETGQMVGEISEWEHSQGRPMLSAVVINKGTNMPGSGFFKLAKDLNKFQGGNKRNFWQNELQNVYNAWN